MVDLQRRVERSTIDCSSDDRHAAALLYGQRFLVDIPHIAILLHERNVLDFVLMLSHNVCFQHAIPKSFSVPVVVWRRTESVYFPHCLRIKGEVFFGAGGASGKGTINSRQGHR